MYSEQHYRSYLWYNTRSWKEFFLNTRFSDGDIHGTLLQVHINNLLAKQKTWEAHGFASQK